ncbi:MAG: FHA domain-containing protein [Deltaproteobacteria bacterium]|nr:FHA domain-containing protein [Deltaproteobacteria bacterium]
MPGQPPSPGPAAHQGGAFAPAGSFGGPPAQAPVMQQAPATAFAPPQQPATPYAPPPATPYAPPPATPYAPPPAATAFAPPPATPYAPPPAATAFAPPQQPATAFAPPQTAFAPPQPQASPYAPPAASPFAPPQPQVGPSFEPSVAHPTRTPSPGQGLHHLHKGATSFPTTCPNPSCQKQVLVPPGGTAQCAFCGTLVDSNGSAVSSIPTAQNFGLTGAASESAAAAAAAAVAAVGGTVALQQGLADVRSVILQGSSGTFRVLAGIESRVGRDGGMCSIALDEPRVSGVHATLKLDGGLLFVRDDRSHNGTFVNGNRIAPGTWTPVPGGSQLRFGPVEFVVRHES